VCVFLLFWYLPLQKRIKAVKQTKAAQTLTIAKGTADSKQLPLLKEQLLKLQTELENYEVNIPEQRALGVFLRRIADLMNEHNLREQVIEPREEIEGDELHCIPVNMQCKGKLGQILEFYRRLQALNRLVRIEKVKLCNDSDYNGQVSMETRAVVYYRTKVGQG
jgi:Tfp pilus assembly protein PilO